MSRFLVIGGRGFLGSRTAAALRRIPGADVAIASRSGGEGSVQLDILDSSSRPAMAGYDVVVNCSDSLEAPPERAAEDRLRSGIIFVETSAHPQVVQRLHDFSRGVPDPSGVVVLCAGLFPGMSNLLAAELCDEVPPGRLEVTVRYSPLSQAGGGVCRLMADLLGQPAQRYEGGQRIEDPPVSVGGRVRVGAAERSALRVGLPESLMLHWSTGAESTGSFLVPVPGIPLSAQRVLTLLAPWGLLRWGATQWVSRGLLLAMRSWLLGWRRSAVEIAAVHTPKGGGPARHGYLSVRSGFEGAACATAAAAALLAEQPPKQGVQLIDRALALTDVVERMRQLAGDELGIEVRV